jgi:hypothetical protein
MSVCVGALTGALWASEVQAGDCPPEEPLRHRVALGGGAAATYFNGGQDGHYHEEVWRGGAQVGYGYIVERGLEVGADLVVFNGPVILAGGTIRGYVPLGAHDVVELGLGLHVGLHVVSPSSTTWTGWGAWAGPDVRVWPTERFGFLLAGQAFVAQGTTSRDPQNPSHTYLNEKSAFLGLGAAFAVLMRN